MREFFRGWKRKVGVVTLLMACVFMGRWLRSLNIDLSEEYLKAAGKVARVRAAYAAQRLAMILAEGIGDGSK